jgi:hypothetical protein
VDPVQIQDSLYQLPMGFPRLLLSFPKSNMFQKIQSYCLVSQPQSLGGVNVAHTHIVRQPNKLRDQTDIVAFPYQNQAGGEALRLCSTTLPA